MIWTPVIWNLSKAATPSGSRPNGTFSPVFAIRVPPARPKQSGERLSRNEENVRNKIKQDLQSARIQAAESWQRLETIRKSVESASESLRITQVRYREGVAGITDLLTAQVGLTAMRTRSVAAVYDHAAAVSNLKRARGVLHTLYSVQ